MASKYEHITELYLQTAGEVATPEAWPRFLKTACYNFRLSFDKQVLLYAQRPDATAVLPIEGRQGWNQRFGRWVNRGSKGIAILDSDSMVKRESNTTSTLQIPMKGGIPVLCPSGQSTRSRNRQSWKRWKTALAFLAIRIRWAML